MIALLAWLYYISEVMAMNTPEAGAPQTSDPQLHFIYWYHAPYNIDYVLPELEPADVILLEGADTSLRRQGQGFAEGWVNAHLTAKDSQHRELSIVPSAPDLDAVQPLHHAIAERFAGSGKVVRLIDVNFREYPEVAEAAGNIQTDAERANRNLQVGLSGLNKVMAVQRELFQNQADNINARDTIIKGQIETQRRAFVDKQIAIVYGSAHTQLSYEALKQGYGKRTFVGGIGSGVGEAGVKKHFNLEVEVIRRIQFGKPVSEEFIMRTLLRSSLCSYLAQERGQDIGLAQGDIEQWDYDTADLMPITDKIARSVSTEDLEVFGKRIDDSLWLNGGVDRLWNYIANLVDRETQEV